MRYIEEIGIIKEKKDDGVYVIKLGSNEENCSECPLKNKCRGESEKAIEIKLHRDLSIGEEVKLKLPYLSKSLIMSLIFGVPVVTFVASFFILMSNVSSEGVSILISSLISVALFLLIMILLKNFEKNWVKKIIIEEIGKDKFTE